MNFIDTLTTTGSIASSTSGRAALFGRIEDQEDWVSHDEAEYMAGGLDTYELQANTENGDIYVVEEGEVVEVIEASTFKVINKTTIKGSNTFITLFSFSLNDREVTTFLNTSKDGRTYLGLAWSKQFKPQTKGRAVPK